MAADLARAGSGVTAWPCKRERAEALAADGVNVAGSLAEAVAGADVVMSCLADDAAVEHVVWGDEGALAHGRAGQLMIDTTTLHPALSLRQHAAFAARGGGFVDAPVFGSRNEAANAGLWVVVGGGDADVAQRR